jgi:hypothetical protein
LAGLFACPENAGQGHAEQRCGSGVADQIAVEGRGTGMSAGVLAIEAAADMDAALSDRSAML